jgi:hypothetical protein
VVPVGGVPPVPPPGGAPPPVGNVTPFFFRQAVYLAIAALETPDAAPAPAPAAVVEVVEAVVVEVVLDAEPLLPPQAAAASAVVMRSAHSAPR